MTDLYCHSIYSDELSSPKDLLSRAARRGVKTMALTDHDELHGLKEARETAPDYGIQFIDGVEIFGVLPELPNGCKPIRHSWPTTGPT